MKIRVADYIAQTMVRYGINHVFMVTGGGSMHLNDALGRVEGLRYVCCHHEQACTMAAESYFRMSNRLAAVNVTTGPGGTNAITGVYGAYVDSLGMLVVSGQVKWETLVRSGDLPLRQLGDQEVDIVKMVSSITKYAEVIEDPLSIRYHLEKALYLAVSGRPGPVWLDVPINVQATLIETEDLRAFDSSTETSKVKSNVKSKVLGQSSLEKACHQVLERLKLAKRPVILAGSGVRLAKAHSEFLRLVDVLGIPVTTAWNAHDVIWNDHPYYVGRPGTVGDRAGNFAVQNSDFLLVLGSRLNIRQISYGWENFARAAFKVHVDIDPAELKKPTLKTDLPILADLKSFFKTILNMNPYKSDPAHDIYLRWCLDRKEKYPVVLSEYWKVLDSVNPYCFVDSLFKQLKENELIVTGDGTACVSTFQAANIKPGQRLYTNSGCAAMGYDLPAAIGATLAMQPERLICIAGDGSIMMNLQELQTIVTHRLPIKIFIFNNKGYHSIRQTQQSYFPDNVVGCGLGSGLSFPNFEKIANAFQIPFHRISNHSDMAQGILDTLQGPGTQVCEVLLNLEQQFAPKLSSRKLPDGRMVSSPLEDLAPFLSREEFLTNMLIMPIDEKTLGGRK